MELLRLLVVLFLAGLGYELGRLISAPASVLGPFNGAAVGVIVGSGTGYVTGGMLGRSTVAAVDRTEAALRALSAEALVAGAVGAGAGAAAGTAVAWPLLLVLGRELAVPVFLFVVVVLGLLGARLAGSRGTALAALLGPRAGRAARAVSPAALPRLVDSSVAVDGRVLEVVRAGFLHGRMLVPAFVLDELRGLADAADEARRSRGRRGLELLEALRREPAVDLAVLDEDVPACPEVDAKLVRLALDRGYALLTVDTNLARAATVAGVRVLNLHSLALAVRPAVTAGDEVGVLLTKPGKEPGQAVGYLDDGTMVVVERARAAVGEEVAVRVTSVLTSSSGRMVFGGLVPAQRAGSRRPVAG